MTRAGDGRGSRMRSVSGGDFEQQAREDPRLEAGKVSPHEKGKKGQDLCKVRMECKHQDPGGQPVSSSPQTLIGDCRGHPPGKS